MIENSSLTRSSNLGVLQRINANRGPREYLRMIEQIEREVEELADLSKAHMRAMAALTLTVDTDEIIKRHRNSPGGSVGKKSNIKKPADVAKLQKHYKVTVEMALNLKKLDQIEADMEMNFGRGDKFGMGLESTVKKTLAQLQLVRTRTMAMLNEAYTFMKSLAEGRVPDTFTKMAAAVSRVLQRSLAYKDVVTYLYVYPNEGEIAFTQFFAISDMEDDEGSFFPKYFVVLSGVLNDSGELSFHLNTLLEFSPPGTFELGTEIPDAKKMVQTLSFLLSLDKVSNNIARRPLKDLLADGVSREQFTVKDMVHTLVVDEDELTFYFKKGVTQDEASSAAQQIYLDLRALSRRTQAKIGMKVKKGPKGFLANFVFISPLDMAKTVEDIEHLKDRLGLSDKQLHKMVDVMNRSD